MCYVPGATELAVVATVMSATQGIVSYMGAAADAASQTQYYEQNRLNSLQAYSDDIEANNLDLMAKQEDSTVQRLEMADQGLAARATAKVAAGERGLGGVTAAALEQDIGFQEGSAIANINRNDELDIQRHRLQSRNAKNTATSRINGVRPGKSPSLLALGASIGQSAVSGFQMRSALKAQEA
jgi:hypothetical protein